MDEYSDLFDRIIVHRDIDGYHDEQSTDCWCCPDVILINRETGQETLLTCSETH